jgi:hypothetical protein
LPKLPRLTAKEAEKILLDAGFSRIRSKGSHRITINRRSRFFSNGIAHFNNASRISVDLNFAIAIKTIIYIRFRLGST